MGETGLKPIGEQPGDLAERLPQGAYRFSAPVQRCGLVFARVSHETGRIPFEAGITPEADILSLHLSDFDGRAWSNGSLIHNGPIRRRSLSLVKSGVRSDVRLDGSIDIIQVFLPPAPLARISADLLGRPAQPSIGGWVFDETLAALTIRAFRASFSRHRAALLAAESVAVQLVRRILEHHGGGREDPAVRRYGGIPPWRLRQVIDLVEHQIAGELSLAQLAETANLSPFHFLRAFQLETGLTPHHWVIRRRVARAKELLATSDLSLTEIAAEVGYASQSALTTAFSRIVGTSPGEWRRSLRS